MNIDKDLAIQSTEYIYIPNTEIISYYITDKKIQGNCSVF